VVGEAEDGAQAVARAAELMPDLILRDIRMPTMDGLKATRRIKAAHPSLNIIMLTVVEDVRILSEALEAGADGYLLKGIDPDEFLAWVRDIPRGNAPQRHGNTERTAIASVPDQDVGTSKAATHTQWYSPKGIDRVSPFFPQYVPSGGLPAGGWRPIFPGGCPEGWT
jgi:DNA-binding NarL/FixJ family response regulator